MPTQNAAPEAGAASDVARGTREETCIAEDDALEFAAGNLSSVRGRRIVEHLERCLLCEWIASEALQQMGRQPARGREWLTSFAPGMLLGSRFQIGRFVGKGGMGEVYEAYDRALRGTVAIKTVRARDCDSALAEQRLALEVRLARRVRHPNVCEMHALHEHIFEEGCRVQFASLEFVRGVTLRQLLRSGPLAFSDAGELARQVLAGLQAIHRAGVLHCDLKTDNVMVRAESGGCDRFIITDFGLAEPLQTARRPLGHRANGTPSYMAPEQLRGEALGEQTDLFGLGVVLFEALTGTLPFGTDREALRARTCPAPAPSQMRLGVTPALDGFVRRCLASAADERFSDAGAALAALERATAQP